MSSESLNTVNDRNNIRFVELWASAKVIGRECATINKDWLKCRQKINGDAPGHCMPELEEVLKCTSKM